MVFRFKPANEDNLETLNEQLIKTLNASGKVFISHTKVNGVYCIRMVLGNTRLEQRHVEEVWSWIRDAVKSL